MPLAYAIDSQQRLVTITGDYAEATEWRDLLERVGTDARYQRGFGILRDLRASQHPVNAAAVAGIIAVVRELWATLGVRRAAILTRPGIDVPATIAHALAEDERIPLRAFNTYDDALEWLSES